MFRLVLLLAALMLVACTPTSITFSFGATTTFTPTLIPTATPTQTPDATATAGAQASATAQAKATADAQATATANAQSTATAIAQSTATAQARASATAAAATAQANATSTAQAATVATKTAILAYVDALVAKAGRPLREPQGNLTADNWFWVNGTWKNFVLDVEFSNPADPAVHPWSYGFRFRYPNIENYYNLALSSNGTWTLWYPEKRGPDAIYVISKGSGKVGPMNLSPTGSNKVRFVAYEKSAFLYVNGEYVSMLDLSDNMNEGQLFLRTALLTTDMFPGLIVTFKNLSVAGLP